MGCGKSHIGRMLARARGVRFVDLDRYIVEQEGMTIPEIFEKYGEPHFRELEVKYIRSFSGDAVVATGGGAMLRDETAEFARENGTVYFLNTAFETCYNRIKGDANRPLVQANTKEQLKELYDKRFPVYRKNCTYEINSNTEDRNIVSEITKFVEMERKQSEC
ncbi:MAG: shikimate kinase [Eubacterium sp.]|nr:shikimate kinase [Eubacterium sp.]